MRKLDLKFVRRLLDAPLPAAQVKPRPFPGRFPTRVAFTGLTRDGKVRSYVGKPSFNALWMVNRMSAVRWHVEFDQNNLVMSAVLRGQVEDWRLWNFYHPLVQRAYFLRWFDPDITTSSPLAFGKYKIYRPRGYRVESVRAALERTGNWINLLGMEAK